MLPNRRTRADGNPLHSATTHGALGTGQYAGVGLQFALTFLVFGLAGWWLDGRLGSGPWLMLLGIALGHIMMYIAVQRLGAAITSSCQTLMPFVTAAAASFALSESLSRPQWIAGSVMILGAIVLLSLKHEISSTRRDHD